jgi:uncharacterized protein (DUF58 family)
MPEQQTYLNPEILARITSLGIRADKVVEGTISGQHVSPYHGVSAEFADYQEYKPGDDLKRLDWRIFARSNRYFTKQYEDECNLRCNVLMDASASMKYKSKGAAMSKYDYGATVAASLSNLLIRQQDAVGLALFDEGNRAYLRPASTRTQLRHIVETLENAVPDRETQLGEVMWDLAEKLSRKGLVVVISDLLVDLDKFFESIGRLCYQGHEIMIFHVLDRDELDLPFEGSVIFEDLEGEEVVQADPWAFRKDYQEAMEVFVADLKTRFQTHGIDYLQMVTDEDLGSGLSHYLHWRKQRKVR